MTCLMDYAGKEVQQIPDEEVIICCGGTSEEYGADANAQQICDEVKPYAEEQARKTFDVFTAKSYKAQLVAGTNYFIKVHVGGEDFVHLRVQKSFDDEGKLEFQGIQTPNAQDEPTEYF